MFFRQFWAMSLSIISHYKLFVVRSSSLGWKKTLLIWAIKQTAGKKSKQQAATVGKWVIKLSNRSKVTQSVNSCCKEREIQHWLGFAMFAVHWFQIDDLFISLLGWQGNAVLELLAGPDTGANSMFTQRRGMECVSNINHTCTHQCIYGENTV